MATDPRPAPPPRRFYGRRTGRRLRPGRQQLIDSVLPRLEIVLPEDGRALDPADLFDVAPKSLWFEIGFGGGEHLVWQAERHPDIGFIGCEPFVNGMSTLLAGVQDKGLTNIRVWSDDARLVLDRWPAASLDRVFMLFADPWPKNRHAGRRFVQTETVALLADRMADGAELRIASDDPGLVDWSLWHVRADPAFEWLARGPEDWRHRPEDWPATRYEEKQLHGAPVFLRFRRRPRSDVSSTRSL